MGIIDTGFWRFVLACLAAALLFSAAACKKPPPAVVVVPPKPATQAAVVRVAAPKALTYVNLIRDHYPDFPATQPSGVPLNLDDSAHFVLSEPIYICAFGHLWITRSDAEPLTKAFFQSAAKEQIHLVREKILYVDWNRSENGKIIPTLICDSEAGPKLIALDETGISENGFKAPVILQRRRYHWNRAMTWGDRIFVPADTGISTILLRPKVVEEYHELLNEADRAAVRDGTKKMPAAQYAFDAHPGLLAWIPCDDASVGGGKTAHFVDGTWTDLTPESGWPNNIMYVVPLLDGSVLQMLAEPANSVRLAMVSLEKTPVDEKQIAALVEKLSDDKQEIRDQALADLSRFGPGAWPILEKLIDSQLPEGQARIRQLLQDKIAPTLSGMTIPDGRMWLLSRNPKGGVLFFTQSVSVTIPGQDPRIDEDVYIELRPGASATILPGKSLDEINLPQSKVSTYGEEFMVYDAVQGLRWFDGGSLVPLLRRGEKSFNSVMGRDQRGRWLLRQHPPDELAGYLPTTQPGSVQPATAATTQNISDDGPTMVIDTTLPDPTPRLRVWDMSFAETSGWDIHDWPAIKRGGAWALRETEWQLLDDKTEKMYMTLADMPAAWATSLPTTQPGNDISATTLPATTPVAKVPTTAPTTQEEISLGPCLLKDSGGTRYFDGRATLTEVAPDGTKTIWRLPGNAVGDGTVTLLKTADNLLFLFNVPGRVVRIRATAGEAEPFKVEAIFSHNIPNSDQIRRIWLDPAGRIDIAFEDNGLAVLFPDGRVPPAVAEKIPAGGLQDGTEP